MLKTHTLGNDGYVAENGNQAGGEYAYVATNAKIRERCCQERPQHRLDP
ncbi:MAG: hypothetical protein ACLU9S_04710 [Oscillospiraceae bacterium]